MIQQSQPQVWIAYHSDWTGWAIFPSEVEALRFAVDHSMKVAPLPFGAMAYLTNEGWKLPDA